MNTKEHIEKYLRCIHCGSHVEVGIVENDNGILSCMRCGAQFPIIRGIPRLLVGQLLRNTYNYYHDVIEGSSLLSTFFKRNRKSIGSNSSDVERLKSKTQEQFGYEWHRWPKLPDYAERHFFNVMQKPPVFFQGKMGWDPAVGMGRDIFMAATAVGDNGFMIGSDLSFAVDVSYERCKEIKNILIVQADLYSNFLENNSLDFAYMIGLIQHLTAPCKGIEQVYSKVREKGYFVGTIYTKPKDFFSTLFVRFVFFMRMFTMHLPLSIVYWISYLCALPIYLFFKLPLFILNRFNYVRSMNELYPEHQTQKRKPNLDLLTHTWFDHFTPPIEEYYSDEEILDLLKGVSLKERTLRIGIFSGFKI